MIKQLIQCALTSLTFGAFLSLGAVAATAANRIAIDDAGSVTWTSDDMSRDSITGFQLSLKVRADADAQVTFQFDEENAANICEYRYHEDTECLNIYVADPEPLFMGSETMHIGTVSVRNAQGENAAVSIEAVKDSLQYVYGDTLMNASFDVENTAPTEPSTSAPVESTEPSTSAPVESTEPPTSAPVESTEPPTSAPVESTEPPTSTHIAADEEFCQWAIQNYQSRNGVTAAEAKITGKEENKYEITLFDAAGKILDIYTIDPGTGIGVNAANEAVSLPQTGNNSMTNVLLAFAALMLIAFGVCMVKISGIAVRRKR